jgi:hypothetical protein
MTMNLKRSLLALALFGISFGFVEAAVVEYLRFVWQPVHARYFPDSAADAIFPLLTLDQLRSEGPKQVRILVTELAREAATLVMLAAAGLAVAGNARQWFAAFMIAFGVWDIFFYVFLRVLMSWPESLATWDLLFLLPVPWVGPVWAPVLVSVTMIASGVVVLRRESCSRPVRVEWAHVALIAAGAVTIIVAFCWDWRNIVAGGEPNPFNWPLFGLGLIVGSLSFAHAIRRNHRPGVEPLDEDHSRVLLNTPDSEAAAISSAARRAAV